MEKEILEEIKSNDQATWVKVDPYNSLFEEFKSLMDNAENKYKDGLKEDPNFSIYKAINDVYRGYEYKVHQHLKQATEGRNDSLIAEIHPRNKAIINILKEFWRIRDIVNTNNEGLISIDCSQCGRMSHIGMDSGKWVNDHYEVFCHNCAHRFDIFKGNK